MKKDLIWWILIILSILHLLVHIFSMVTLPNGYWFDSQSRGFIYVDDSKLSSFGNYDTILNVNEPIVSDNGNFSNEEWYNPYIYFEKNMGGYLELYSAFHYPYNHYYPDHYYFRCFCSIPYILINNLFTSLKPNPV